MAVTVQPEVDRLLEQARAGDGPALGELLELYRNYFLLLARVQIGRRLQGKADCADVVQEAYLRAFRYLDTYRGGNAKSWLLRIVRRTCYSWLERNRPPDVVSLEAETETGDMLARVSSDVEGLLESRSDLRRLDQLIEALPMPLRETIVLRELHELGYREIAEVTGMPIGTVMSRLHRARSLLLRAWNRADISNWMDH